METVYRVQDKNGRGPFKPGFTTIWLDDEKDRWLESSIQEFGAAVITNHGGPGRHLGCACRSIEDLERWFSRAERKRLKKFGYNLVSMEVNEILAESKNQLVFCRYKPLYEAATKEGWWG